MLNRIKTKYGFEVGKTYQTCMPVTDERGNFFDTGTLVRLIAIVPKVRIVRGYPDVDRRKYFYNAALANNSNDYPRIRKNFCTLCPKEVPSLTDDQKQRIEEHRKMGEKAARARHRHDEGTAKFLYDQHCREWKLFPEIRAELREAYSRAYRQESESYNATVEKHS